MECLAVRLNTLSSRRRCDVLYPCSFVCPSAGVEAEVPRDEASTVLAKVSTRVRAGIDFTAGSTVVLDVVFGVDLTLSRRQLDPLALLVLLILALSRQTLLAFLVLLVLFFFSSPSVEAVVLYVRFSPFYFSFFLLRLLSNDRKNISHRNE